MKSGKILVTGAEGYIGSVLTRTLLEAGYAVCGVDTGYYNNQSLFPCDRTLTTRKDIRLVGDKDLCDVDAVVCLSDLNDPTSQLYPDQTRAINQRGLKSFANKCKQAGVKRFVYSSSASVYGNAGEDDKSETSYLKPLTPYAECKVNMEKHLSLLNDNDFQVACMRNATVYGLSPSMRFDLVVNYLCGSSIANDVVRLKSDGGAWRPFVHINDLCEAFMSILKLPDDKFSGLIVNVGNGSNGNHRVIDVANIIHGLTGSLIKITPDIKDNRSYRLNTDKLESLGIECARSMHEEIKSMINFLQSIQLNDKLLHNSSFNRTSRIRDLIESEQVDGELYWK